VTAPHPGWAERAAATAAETSASPDRATVHNGEPSAGRSFSNVWPNAAGAERPSTRFAIEEILYCPSLVAHTADQ
jgi:hypothetical protein